MPNWCENKVIVNGDNVELSNMVNFIGDDNSLIIFNKIIPVSPEEFDTEKGHYFRIGYWGTKWEPEVFEIEILDHKITMLFDTAWSPSLGITEKLSELYPTLKFVHLYEVVGEQSGMNIWKNGHLVLEKSGQFGQYRVREYKYYGNSEEYE